MTNSNKLSLFSLILVNINIMVGSGIFINTAILAKQSGSVSPLTYAMVGIIVLPIMMSIAKLWQFTKGACTLYHFGLAVSPFFGFLSSWSYFIAKISSFALGIHVCASFLQQIIPALNFTSTLTLDVIFISLFTIFNLFNVKTGMSIQYTFLFLKLTPLLFAIFSGLYAFSSSNFSIETTYLEGIPAGIPLVLFAFLGFEASCSISQLVENPAKNGPRAILISFFVVISLVILYQLMFFGSLGTALGRLTGGYLDIFPALLSKVFNDIHLKNTISNLLHIGIASSSLGASYGIMFSNSWNLYTIAQFNHTFGKKFLTKLNSHNTPYACVIVQGILGVFYLLLTNGYQIPLQQVGALGATIAYTFSIVSLLVINYKNTNKISLLPVLGIISCMLLFTSFAFSIQASGVSSLIVTFMLLILFGSFMFYKSHEPHKLDVYEHL